MNDKKLTCYRGVDDCRIYDGTVPYDRMSSVIRYTYSDNWDFLRYNFSVIEKVEVIVPTHVPEHSEKWAPLIEITTDDLNYLEISEYHHVEVLETFSQSEELDKSRAGRSIEDLIEKAARASENCSFRVDKQLFNQAHKLILKQEIDNK